jgi:hypothetical protein
MQRKISILTKFSMSDWHQMDRFIAKTHGEKHVLRNRSLFDWFFLRNKNKDEANLIVAYEGDKLISLLGYLPTRFLWGNEEITGVWMAHWMTLEEYRFGIGALLMKKITELFPIVAGQGASHMNQKIVTKMNFKFIEQIPKVVYVLNYNKIMSTFNFQVEKNIDCTTEKYGVPKETTTISKEKYCPNWILYPSLRYGTLRNCDYLKYRYIDYPFFKYHIFIEGESSAPAVCVVRIIDTTTGIRIARILEFFFPENESGKTQGLFLIKKCLNYFKQHHCDYADFYCNATAYMDLLLEAGFIIENMGDLPSLLDPIDMSRRYQNMELFVSTELKKKYPNCENEFIVTRADGDQDRPNESYRNIY